MTRLFIHGIGACALGFDEPMKHGVSRIDDVPVKDYAALGLRRRFGRLAKLIYVAASRAIHDAGSPNPGELAIVEATALGEVEASLALLTQIYESKGKPPGPALVPNSVHNSAAGYLSIGLGTRKPSLTVSQGFLSAEAGVAAAADLVASGAAESVLIAAGDEADPAWVARLLECKAGDWAERLEKERFQEGAVALVVGSKPGGRNLGSMTASVERIERSRGRVASLLKRNRVEPGKGAKIVARFGIDKDELGDWARVSSVSQELGSSMAGALALLADRIKAQDCGELLLLGSEIDEIGFIHWLRGA